MRTEVRAGALGITGLMLATIAVLPNAPATPVLPRPEPAHAAGAFPPRALRVGAHSGSPAVLALDGDIARLGSAPPRLHPLRRAFLDSHNLMQFALDRLPQAIAGDGASQYFIYLALDQCRSYLRTDFDAARANLEAIEATDDLTTEERSAWLTEYERCRGFSAGDWSALGAALGEEKPGAEVEYASVWFEWAAQSGYGPALAEQALRPSPYRAEEREAMLEQALSVRDADVDWLLFAHSGDVQTGDVNAVALAWLIAACRAGQDCSENARWYRAFVCAQADHRCVAGQSALQYYWLAATAREREEAWIEAARIEAALGAQQWQKVPLPDLDALDYHDTWGRTEDYGGTAPSGGEP